MQPNAPHLQLQDWQRPHRVPHQPSTLQTLPGSGFSQPPRGYPNPPRDFATPPRHYPTPPRDWPQNRGAPIAQ